MHLYQLQDCDFRVAACSLTPARHDRTRMQFASRLRAGCIAHSRLTMELRGAADFQCGGSRLRFIVAAFPSCPDSAPKLHWNHGVGASSIPKPASECTAHFLRLWNRTNEAALAPRRQGRHCDPRRAPKQVATGRLQRGGMLQRASELSKAAEQRKPATGRLNAAHGTTR